MKKYITLNGKDYVVIERADGTQEVYAQWEGYDISQDRWSAFSSTVQRTKLIDPQGRIGKKVIAACGVAA
jgi:hypothetical protein